MNWASILLTLAAVYCAVMYGWAAYRTFRFKEDYEVETFHLGLCFVIALGFLSLSWC